MTSAVNSPATVLPNGSWHVCVNARDTEGKTDIIQGSVGTGSLGGSIGPIMIRNGWYEADGGPVGNGQRAWTASLIGANNQPNNTIIVQQIAFAPSGTPCPGAEAFQPGKAATRQNMASFLHRAAGYPGLNGSNTKCGSGKPGPFKDVKGDNPYCYDIEWMRTAGLTTGYDDGTFKPAETVSRQAAASFLYRAAGSPGVPTAAAKCGSGKPGPFKDVPGTHAFCKEIEWMRASGLSTGYGDGTFKPAETVSRQAAVAFIWRLKGEPAPTEASPLYSDVPSSHEFSKAIQWLMGITYAGK